MENAFPLPRLPNPDQQRVLRCLRHIDQLSFSILSKKAKYLLHSLRIKIDSAALKIEDPIELTLYFPIGYHRLQLFLNFDGDLKSVGNAPDSASLVDRWAPHPTTILRSLLTLQDWIIHIFHVYHGSHIRKITFSDQSLVYDISSIKAALRGVEIPLLSIGELNNEALFKNTTKLFLPTKRLTIDHNYGPEDTNFLRRVLASNFDFFGVVPERFPYFASLDNFLSINASTIVFDYSDMTDKDLNRFIKLWIKGAMPRLKRLFMPFITDGRGQVWSKNVILNGIQYTEMGRGEKKNEFFEWLDGPWKTTVSKGLNILRCDGVNATIELDYHDENLFDFHFYVWE